MASRSSSNLMTQKNGKEGNNKRRRPKKQENIFASKVPADAKGKWLWVEKFFYHRIKESNLINVLIEVID